MTTLNGFLYRSGPKDSPRLTAGQKDLVTEAATFVLARHLQGEGTLKLVAELVSKVLRDALDSYPTDRSCFTCDYYRSGTCANNDHQEVPVPFRDRGCESWKDDGAPF